MRTHALLFLTSFVALVLPSTASLRTTVGSEDWRASPRFDGTAYVVSDEDVVPQQADATGAAAVLATLRSWSGDPATEAEVHDSLVAQDFGYRLADFAERARELGFAGQWLRTEPDALDDLKVPFIAHLTAGGGRFVIVRDVRSGYVYAADPTRGNVLYPQARFEEDWSGRVLAFPDPPAAPEPWR